MRWTKSLGRLGTCLALACGAAQAQQPYPQTGWNPLAAGPAGPAPAQHVVPYQPGPPPGPSVGIPTPPPNLGQTDANPEGKPPLDLTPVLPPNCPPPVVMQPAQVDGQLVARPCIYPQMIGGTSMDYFYRPLIRIPNPGPVTAYRMVEPRTPTPQYALPAAVLSNFPRNAALGETFGVPPNVGLFALPGPQAVPGELETVMQVPAPTRGAWRIADNESPQPQDRVYVSYNFLQDTGERLNEGLLAAFRLPNGTLLQSNGQTVLVPMQPPRLRVHQLTIGAEKTIPTNENVSFGVRIPVYGIRNGVGFSDDNLDKTDLGDISFNIKVAIANELAYSGWLASTGVMATAPTGPDYTNFDGEDVHQWIVQPYLAGLRDFGGVYVHGFTSVAIPVDGPEPVLLFGDLGAGWYAYRSDYFFLSAIVPTVEAHATIPLTHRASPDAAVRTMDMVVATAGVHFVFGPGNCTLSFGGSVPVFAPQPFEYQLITQLDFRF